MSNAYEGLRDLALHTLGDVAGRGRDDGRPFGVVMDMGLAKGTATVVAFADGTASIYLSSGGGFIGGGAHESVNKAAKAAVETAAQFVSQLRPANEHPLPQAGFVNFYILTADGVMSASASERELYDGEAPLRKLYAAMQDIITQYRAINP